MCSSHVLFRNSNTQSPPSLDLPAILQTPFLLNIGLSVLELLKIPKLSYLDYTKPARLVQPYFRTLQSDTLLDED